MDADRKQGRRTDPNVLDGATPSKGQGAHEAPQAKNQAPKERVAAEGAKLLVQAKSLTLSADFADDSRSAASDRAQAERLERQAYAQLATVGGPVAQALLEVERAKVARDPQLHRMIQLDSAKFEQARQVLGTGDRPAVSVPQALQADEVGVRAAAAEVARKATAGFEPPTNDNWSFRYKDHDLIARQVRPGVVDVLNSKHEVLFPGKTAQEINAVSPEPGRPKPIDIGADAQLREAARSTIAANGRQAEVKREVVDHMTADELKRFAAAGADKPKAEQILRDAAAREERASATGAVRDPVPPLADRFNISRRLFTKEYEFRDQPGKIAFSERFNKLRSEHNTPAAAIAMIDRAGERGWSSVRVTGSAEFKRQAWIAAEARGMKAIGYEPTKGDIDAARAERERLARETTWRGGSAERAKDPQEISSVPRGPEGTADRPVKRDDDRQAPSQSTRPAEPRRDEPRAAEPAATAKRSEDARGAATPDIPSLAGSGAQRDDKDRKDPAQRAGANPDRCRDREREPEQAVLRGVSSAAYMRALEQVMERDGVPMERRPEIRTVAERQFAALRAEGKTVRVPLVDREAPRRVPVQLPQYEVKRAAQERAR